jgi:hypothetical protein
MSLLASYVSVALTIQDYGGFLALETICQNHFQDYVFTLISPPVGYVSRVIFEGFRRK